MMNDKAISYCSWGEEIDGLLMDPKLYRYNLTLLHYYEYIASLNEILERTGRDKITALWGGGRHTGCFYRFLLRRNREKITYIIDNNGKTHSDPYGFHKTYIDKDEAVSKKIDVIIISSFAWRTQIAEEIRASGIRADVIDVYETLKEKDIDTRIPFFSGVDYSYREINTALRDFPYMERSGLGNCAVKRLIGEYLHVRDFVNAFRWIDKLPQNDEDKEYYLDVREKTERLLRMVHKNISGKKHITVNWIDGMVPDEVINMPFLASQLSGGINFTNAHCVAAFTQATMKAVFTGKMHLDDHLYKKNVYELADAPLSRLIRENGYEFKYFGIPYCRSLFFNERTVYVQQMSGGNYRNCASTLLQWEAVREMEENNGRCFVLIHNIQETHYPFGNGVQPDPGGYEAEDLWGMSEGFMQPEWDKIRRQIVRSQGYLDGQLQFYHMLYKDIRYRIYMSDHGLYRCGRTDDFTRFTHVVFGIAGKKIVSGTEAGMFSLVSFPSVIAKLFSDETDKICEETKPYIFIQDEDGYNDTILRYFYINRELSENRFIQQKGVITTEDSYYRTVLGKEFYFRRDRTGNQIENERFYERIAYLKSLVGNQFIDITNENKYVNTRKIYEILGYKVSGPNGTDSRKQRTGGGCGETKAEERNSGMHQ